MLLNLKCSLWLALEHVEILSFQIASKLKDFYVLCFDELLKRWREEKQHQVNSKELSRKISSTFSRTLAKFRKINSAQKIPWRIREATICQKVLAAPILSGIVTLVCLERLTLTRIFVYIRIPRLGHCLVKY